MKRYILATLFLLLLPFKTNAVIVNVVLEDPVSEIIIGDIFTVNILADISEPVLGWGLDLNFDSSLVNLTASPVIGPDWFAAISSDGDGLAGLAFPVPISGTDILLASLSFEAIDAGSVVFSAGVTPFDLTEGFPLALAAPGEFATVEFVDQPINIKVPEPQTLFILLIGLTGLFASRRVY